MTTGFQQNFVLFSIGWFFRRYLELHHRLCEEELYPICLFIRLWEEELYRGSPFTHSSWINMTCLRFLRFLQVFYLFQGDFTASTWKLWTNLEPTNNDNRVLTKFCAVLHWMIFSTIFGIASGRLVRRGTVPDLYLELHQVRRGTAYPICLSSATCRSLSLCLGVSPALSWSQRAYLPSPTVNDIFDGERRVALALGSP